MLCCLFCGSLNTNLFGDAGATALAGAVTGMKSLTRLKYVSSASPATFDDPVHGCSVSQFFICERTIHVYLVLFSVLSDVYNHTRVLLCMKLACKPCEECVGRIVCLLLSSVG